MFLFNHPIKPRYLAASAIGLLASLAGSVVISAPLSINTNIKIDQFGYLNASKKVAIIANPQLPVGSTPFYAGTAANAYKVKRWTDDVVVYSGTLTAWNGGATHAQSGDKGWWFDFSSVTTPGSYYIFDATNNVGSYRFEINDNVYDDVLKQAGRMFYYQRLNQSHDSSFAGAGYVDGASFTQDSVARDHTAKTNAATARNLSGGWMDAGDTNKYTTFAEPAVLQLLEAYRMNPTVFTDSWNIPESGNGLPDILDEVKWELDFLKRMQDATGTNGFLLKVGVDTYAGDVSPLSLDKRPRYYVGECTSATLSGAAMLAAASVVYKPIASQVAYGTDLLNRAEAAWARAKITTNNFNLANFQTDCDPFLAGQQVTDVKAGDADKDPVEQMGSAVKAAIYLYEATQKLEYKTFVESNYLKMIPYSVWNNSTGVINSLGANGWWVPYRFTNELALLRYSILPGVTASVATKIRTDKQNAQNTLRTEYLSGSDLYRSNVADGEFGETHNAIRSNIGSQNLNSTYFGLDVANTNTYSEISQQHAHWLHGANPLGLTYLTRMSNYGAEKSLTQLVHQWFMDGSAMDNNPASGYMTGGANINYNGTNPNIRNQPRQKAYLDWNNSAENAFQLTEPAIYYQSAYVMLLSRQMKPITITEVPAYFDALGTGWSNWGWGNTTNFTNTNPIKVGTYSMQVIYQPWSGAVLRHDTDVAFTSANAAIRFWAYSPTAVTINVYTQSTDTSGQSTVIPISLPANTWKDVWVTREQLGNPNVVKAVTMQLYSPSVVTVTFDQVRVVQ